MHFPNSQTTSMFANAVSCISKARTIGMDPLELLIQDTRKYHYGQSTIDKAAVSTTPLSEGFGLGNTGLEIMSHQPNSFIDQASCRIAPFREKVIIGEPCASGLIDEYAHMPVLQGISNYTVEPVKAGGIWVATKETMRSDSSASESFRNKQTMATAVASSNSGVIEIFDSLSDLVVEQSTGEPLDDISAAAAEFDNVGDALLLIVNPSTALALTLKNNSGELCYPNMTPQGGELSAGIRVLVFNEVGETNSGGSNAYLVDPSGLLKNPGELFIDMADSASLQMSDTPGDTGTYPTVSLFQLDLIAMKVVRVFGLTSFKTCVARIEEVNW